MLVYPQVTRISQLLQYSTLSLHDALPISTRLSQVTRTSQNSQISQEPLRRCRASPQRAARPANLHELLLKTCSDRSVVSLWRDRSLIFCAEHVLDFGISE